MCVSQCRGTLFLHMLNRIIMIIKETQQVASMLKGMKDRTGDVVLIAITKRTTIELPAHLSQEERDARVANYLKLHQSKI